MQKGRPSGCPFCVFAVLLPEEVVERVSAGVDFRHHLVDVFLEFVYAFFLDGGYEDARNLLVVDALVFDFFEAEISVSLGLE